MGVRPVLSPAGFLWPVGVNGPGAPARGWLGGSCLQCSSARPPATTPQSPTLPKTVTAIYISWVWLTTKGHDDESYVTWKDLIDLSTKYSCFGSIQDGDLRGSVLQEDQNTNEHLPEKGEDLRWNRCSSWSAGAKGQGGSRVLTREKRAPTVGGPAGTTT